MTDIWEVFKCHACPPDSEKRWDLALLYEHYAKCHMDGFHMYTCPKCQRKLATPLCAKFHITSCGVDENVEMTESTKNLVDIPFADFQKLQEGVVASIKLHLAEMIKKPACTGGRILTEASRVSDDDIIELSDDDDEVFVVEATDNGESTNKMIPEKRPPVSKHQLIPQPDIRAIVSKRIYEKKKHTLGHSSSSLVAPFVLHANVEALPAGFVPNSNKLLPAAPRSAAICSSRQDQNLPYFQEELENTDVCITLKDAFGEKKELFFYGWYLTKYSLYFAERLRTKTHMKKKHLLVETEYTTFVEAMSAFYNKPIPDFDLLCDRTNGNGMREEARLLKFCRAVEEFDLRGARYCSQLDLFGKACPQSLGHIDCPQCIDRIAVALRFKLEIPANLKFSRGAIAQWTSRKATLAHRLGNVDAVLQYLKASG